MESIAKPEKETRGMAHTREPGRPKRQCVRLKQITFQGEFLPSPRKATTQAHKKTRSQTPSPSW